MTTPYRPHFKAKHVRREPVRPSFKEVRIWLKEPIDNDNMGDVVYRDKSGNYSLVDEPGRLAVGRISTITNPETGECRAFVM